MRRNKGQLIRPSVSEIAKRAGVSKSTVSLVLNNRPHVTESMRKRVLDALEELQTQSPGIPRWKGPFRILLLHPAHMGSIQVFRELLQGIHRGIEDTGGRLTLAVHQPPLHPNHTTNVLLLDPTLRPHGVLLMGALRDDPILDVLKKENLPTVLVARETAFNGFSAVGMDNFKGAKEAVEYLIRLGHKRIAFMGGNEQFEYTRNRLAGYKDALSTAGIPSEQYVYLGTGDDAAHALLSTVPSTSIPSLPVTAIFFVNDEHASQALPVLQKKGIRIPTDLSVIAFDDTEIMAQWDPPISSVAVPRLDIGVLAVKSLVEQITRPSIESIRIILRTQLRIRDTSVAPPKE
ncbi:MAG: LacI family transcriptional regulator [Spirochaetes bacterium]|nr:LacI family transcriptional regulator [Spirochaetota bacterium]